MLGLTSNEDRSVSLDAAMELNTIGYFHYRLLLMCGLTFMTDALEVTLLAFLSACAAAEWNLSDVEQATLTAMVFLGIVVGSIFWGWYADKYGRRPAYLYSCLVIIAGGLLTTIAPSYVWLTVFRAATGFGIGGASVPFDLLAEFMPVSHRGKFLVLTELFWTLGSMFVAGMAWSILPLLGWRMLAFICAIPVILVSSFSYFCLPESPRWLISKHRERDASRILREAAAVNGVVLPEFHISCDPDLSKGEPGEADGSYFDLVATPSARSITFPLWLIWGFFGFTYYGLILFVSRIYSNDSAAAVTAQEQTRAKCDFDYPPIFYNAASESFAILISAALIDRMGRKLSQSFFYALGGLATVFLGLQWSPDWVLFLSILARMCAMSSTVATWVTTPELFPTQLRASGHSTCTAVSKLCSFCAPYLVQSRGVGLLGVGCVLGALNFLAAGCAQLLPETGQGDLAESHSGDDVIRDESSEVQATDETLGWIQQGVHQSKGYAALPTSGSPRDRGVCSTTVATTVGKRSIRNESGGIRLVRHSHHAQSQGEKTVSAMHCAVSDQL